MLGGLDVQARAALLARQAAGMELEEGAGELGEVRDQDRQPFRSCHIQLALHVPPHSPCIVT